MRHPKYFQISKRCSCCCKNSPSSPVSMALPKHMQALLHVPYKSGGAKHRCLTASSTTVRIRPKLKTCFFFLKKKNHYIFSFPDVRLHKPSEECSKGHRNAQALTEGKNPGVYCLKSHKRSEHRCQKLMMFWFKSCVYRLPPPLCLSSFGKATVSQTY